MTPLDEIIIDFDTLSAKLMLNCASMQVKRDLDILRNSIKQDLILFRGYVAVDTAFKEKQIKCNQV